MTEKTTWRNLIAREMERHDDCFDNHVASAAVMPERWDDEDSVLKEAFTFEDDSWLDLAFYPGYGSAEGAEFTLWTCKRVYFPVRYDGSEWCGSVSRNPNGKVTPHQGGG